jgi:hypothetical protein
MQYFAHDEIRIWIEQGTSIHIKAISPSGDPVELNEHEARNLANHLTHLVDQLESLGKDSDP